jgi:hypothetical protein
VGTCGAARLLCGLGRAGRCRGPPGRTAAARLAAAGTRRSTQLAVVVRAAAQGLAIAMVVGAVGFRRLAALSVWMMVGYLGRAFRKAWNAAR